MEHPAAPGRPRRPRRRLPRLRGRPDAGRVRQSARRARRHRDLLGRGRRRGRRHRPRAHLPRQLDGDGLRLRRRPGDRGGRVRHVPFGRAHRSGDADPDGHRGDRVRGRAHRPVHLLRRQRADQPDHLLAARLARPGHLAEGARRPAVRAHRPARRPLPRPPPRPARARRTARAPPGRGRGAAADRPDPGGGAAHGGGGRGLRHRHLRRPGGPARPAHGERSGPPLPGAGQRAGRRGRPHRRRPRGPYGRGPGRTPLGVLTALIGSPFFFWLLRRTRRKQGGWA